MRRVTAILSHLYSQTTPRGRGMLLLVAVMFLLAIATGEAVVYRMTLLPALLVVASYVCARLKLWRLEMSMQDKSHVAQVGHVLRSHVHVRNRSPLPTGWVEIVQMTDMPDSVSGMASAIPGRGEDHLQTATLCHARGVYTIGPLLARTSDPLGLFQVQTVQGNPVRVVVQPPVVPLPHFHLPVAERPGDEGASYRSQAPTPNVAAVREYIHGDRLNRIHWLSTAKRGQLMSKEFDTGGGGDVWIVLDLERNTHHTRGTQRSDEYAVAIAASLAHLALMEECSVGLIAHGDREYLLPLVRGVQQMTKVLDTLILSKTEGDHSLADVLLKNATRFERYASLLVVTSSTDVEWTSVLRQLRYRSLNIAVVLVDPTSFGGQQSQDNVVVRLLGAGIPTYVVREGDRLTDALSEPITLDYLPALRHDGGPEQAVASRAR